MTLAVRAGSASAGSPRRGPGRLVCLGTGIQLGDITDHTRWELIHADKLLYLGADPLFGDWIARFNSTAESLHRFYREGKPRARSYAQMVKRIMRFVRLGKRVCVAIYGHPGIYVDPTHEAIRLARTEGFRAEMRPGLSAEDYLVADLGIDPAAHGCQSFDATDFFVCRRRPDPTCLLLLWQISLVGELRMAYSANPRALQQLVADLVAVYGATHDVVLYEAPVYRHCKPVVIRTPLSRLPETEIPPVATLCIPPRSPARPDPQRLALIRAKPGSQPLRSRRTLARIASTKPR